jgi:hypothetical protein
MRFSAGLLAAILSLAQAPRVGEIEFYGFRKVPVEKARKVLGVQPGDPLPPSKGNVEERLEEVSGIVEARLEAVCCEDGKAVLFVGVLERGAQHAAFRSPPAGDAVLPQAIVDLHGKFVQAVETAARRGSTAEDLTEGHSLMADPAARDIQKEFVPFAADNLEVLKSVISNGPEPEQRAIATAVIAYAPDKKAVIPDLQIAMQDPDESVRANAMRALTAIAVLGVRQPGLAIRIEPTWFVEMLNSIALSDRTRAAAALVNLTEQNAAGVLDQVRDRALDAVLEMARWKTLAYALPAFILAGRVAGMADGQIQDAWKKGDREAVLEKARAAAAPRRRR